MYRFQRKSYVPWIKLEGSETDKDRYINFPHLRGFLESQVKRIPTGKEYWWWEYSWQSPLSTYLYETPRNHLEEIICGGSF